MGGNTSRRPWEAHVAPCRLQILLSTISSARRCNQRTTRVEPMGQASIGQTTQSLEVALPPAVQPSTMTTTCTRKVFHFDTCHEFSFVCSVISAPHKTGRGALA